jgi:hypothetical protein
MVTTHMMMDKTNGMTEKEGISTLARLAKTPTEIGSAILALVSQAVQAWIDIPWPPEAVN